MKVFHGIVEGLQGVMAVIYGLQEVIEFCEGFVAGL